MDRERLVRAYALLVKAAVRADRRDVPDWRFDGQEIRTAQDIATAMKISVAEAEERVALRDIPGWEGSVGPFPGQYSLIHRYARDVHSGAGNCVCGRHEDSSIHVRMKDVYSASGMGTLARGIGTRTAHRDICQRANALAYGYRRRRRRKKKEKQ
jgi:hypothetical protein